MKKETVALSISSGIGVLIFGITFFTLSKEYQEEYPKPVATEIEVDSSGKPLDKGEIATIGQTFVQTMASYDQEQNQPIKLMGVEQVNTIWQAKYEVEQVFENNLSLVYYYTVDIDQGHVVRQNVSVSDRLRRVLLSNPEPDSIVEQKAFTVKGQVFDGQEQVELSIIDPTTGIIVYKTSLAVELDNEAVYSKVIGLSEELFGEYHLQISDGQSLVQTTIVVSSSDE